MNRVHTVKELTRHTDWFLLISCIAASLYGLLLIYSANISGSGGNPTMQALCLLFGILAACFISFINYRSLAARWYLLALPSLVLMALTFTPLGYEVPGTDDRNWLLLPLGSQNFLLQPSELLKIAFIVTFSHHIATLGDRIRKPFPLLGLCAHGALPILLIFLQGDDGNAFICIVLFTVLLIVGGLPLRYILGGTVSLAAVIPFVWQRMSPDKKARFLCLFQVDTYRNTTGWQQELSVTAIGAGGIHGVGYLQGGKDNLYARQNDFIFTVAGEEFGFLGAILVLALLSLILLFLYRNARKSTEPTGQLLCMGLLILIASQAIVNIGMALRVMPVLGITLPFFSAGGSSLLTLFLGVGIAMSVYRYRYSRY
ncbi:MAG: FtsW/RodA/SpoVE family cell cycle protein [Clostridia bacterium]|nr:FtsW/RodA/SpoVE family cell cycle protein [Clostridia bacterium]